MSGPSHRSATEQLVDEERRRALRYLLMHPLVEARGAAAEDFVLIRRHAAHLRDWFGRYPQWRLVIEPEMARLYKSAATTDDATRPARTPGGASGTAFTRRSYALFCLALAALERLDRQTTIGRLADDVASLAASDAEIAERSPIDFALHEHRRDLVQGIKLMEALGLLTKVDGDDQQFLSQKGDALYNVNRLLLGSMLAARRSPSTVAASTFDARLAELTVEQVADTEDGRNRRIRTQLVRRLLDDPVLYDDALSPDERRYLQTQRAHLERIVGEATGLVPETRREGIAMVDEGGSLSDVGMPESGTTGHCTLLLAEYFADRHRRSPGASVGEAEIQQHVAGLVSRFKTVWRKGAAEAGAERELAHLALERLTALGLVRRLQGGAYLPLAAVARYRVAAPVVAGQRSLFDEEPAP